MRNLEAVSRFMSIFRKEYKLVTQNSDDEERTPRAQDIPKRFDSDWDHDGIDHSPGNTIYYLTASLMVICVVTTIMLVTKARALTELRNECTSGSTTFQSPLGRDARYMSIDHGFDFLWDPMLAERLGEFTTDGGVYEHGEYSM